MAQNSRTESTARQVVAEGVGTALLAAAIIGSGIMAERFTGGNTGVALLANALASGIVLVAIVAALGPISGGHFNPAVTLADALQGGLRWSKVPLYVVAQCIGGVLGVVAANIMFDHPAFAASQQVRTGMGQWVGEIIATFGLLAVIFGCVRKRPEAAPYAIGGYLIAAICFTSSTSFANPAVTLARSFTDAAAGIRLADVFPFIGAQLLGMAAVVILFRWLTPPPRSVAKG